MIINNSSETRPKIGLSDIGLYIPKPKMDLEVLEAERVYQEPKLARHFKRASDFTGQEAIRYPEIWEDTVTMAAEAAKSVLERKKPAEVNKLRYLAAGTETGVDHSKPLSAYVEGMLQDAGLNVPTTLSSFQVQHACASGTMALLSVGSMLTMSSNSNDKGLVLASDIARYNPGSTAEITQGAGAAALLLENNPKLLELDLSNVGYCSRNVDDFFRPIGSKIAKVKGRYSMDCYVNNLKEAVQDHCNRKGTSPTGMLVDTDFFVLHAPFRSMPEMAMQALLSEHFGLVNGQTEAFLGSRNFYSGIEPVSLIGNTYSASMYIGLAYLLKNQFEIYKEKIVGQRFLLASYGSGNTMIVISGRVAEGAPEVIEQWDLQDHLDSARTASIDNYEEWVHGPYGGEEYNEKFASREVPEGSFYLANIRKDGYREYSYKTRVLDGIEESETSGNLHGSKSVLG